MKKSLVILLYCLLFLPLLSLSQKKAIHQKKTRKENPGKPIFEKQDTIYLYDTTAYSLNNTDSLNWIQDSLVAEDDLNKAWQETAKIYNEKWYPRDSLSYVDDAVHKLIRENDTASIDGMIAIFKRHFKTDLQKARAVYYWVASTIQYDFESFTNNTVLPLTNKELDAVLTYQSKKGVCQNFANLYKYICNRAGIESEVLVGSGKNFPMAIKPGNEANHAWNSVKTEGGWLLLDATWGGIDSTRVDNYWFGTAPEQFIYSHFPDDPSWQLLKQQLTKKQFLNYPIITPFLFKSKFDFEIPEYGSFVVVTDKFSISKPMEDKNYSIAYTVSPYRGDDWKPYLTNMEEQQVETTALPDKKNQVINYETSLPSKGTWWVKVSLSQQLKNKELQEISFPDAIIFRVTYR